MSNRLSAYARQFLDMMQKPDVDHISGLSPAISIEQKTTSKNPRSTVGTVTEIYDYMRLLFARAGTPYSPATGLPIEAQQVQDMVDRVMAMEEGTRAYLLAPIVRDRKGEYRKEIPGTAQAGLPAGQGQWRILRTGRAADAGQEIPPRHRRGRRPDRGARGAGDAAGGFVPHRARSGRRHRRFWKPPPTGDEASRSASTFSEKFACPVSGFTIPEIEPRLFSFNAPVRGLPGLRRSGRRVVLRRTPRRARRHPENRGWRAGPVAQGQIALFPADHRGDRQALRVQQERPVEGHRPEGAGGLPARIGRGRDQVPL